MHSPCPPRAKEVLRDLKSVVKSTDAAETYAMGFGLGFRVMGVKAGTSCPVCQDAHHIVTCTKWLQVAQLVRL